MSPGSSPESPMAKAYQSAFAISSSRPRTSGELGTVNTSTPFFELQRSSTPAKKPRNLKNLAVNTAGSLHVGRAASTTSLPVTTALDKLALNKPSEDQAQAKSFTKPPSPPKRKPNNLGLTITTTANSRALPPNVRLAIPPTPSLTRPNVLRHFQSSPSLPLYTSDAGFNTTSIVGPPISDVLKQQNGSRSPLKSDDLEPNFDIPQSKEEKPDAYPNGPICVYGPHLDLYLEPTVEQALEYDVIMNVASEVKNPFDKTSSPVTSGPEFRLDGGGGIQYAPKRNFLTTRSNTFQGDMLTPVHESSPTTPKATPSRDTFGLANAPRSNKGAEPEYIHVPWEHNTDIVLDLLRLVKLIDDRVQHGKRVLIHCQCGVSRSATLVVAYVIFKNPSMSVQEAYDTVKKRSRWIGPNMNLIMQLQEFRSSLGRSMNRFGSIRGSLSPISPSLPLSEWGRPGPHSDAPSGITSPQTAPLQGVGASSTLSVVSDLAAVSPGPSSAPSGFAWPSQDEAIAKPANTVTVTHQDAAYVDPSGNVVPVVKIVEEASTSDAAKMAKEKPQSLNLESHNRQDSGRHITPMLSPRSTEFAMIPLQPPKDVDSADQFGLMSPQASEFTHSPFDRESLLGALGMGSALQPASSRPQHLNPTPAMAMAGTTSTNKLPLRPKISAPSLREQRQLQNLQSEIEANMTKKVDAVDLESMPGPEALMSPRAIEFTQNPFALPDDSREEQTHPASSMVGQEDPRSPAQKGASPIIRNIFDVL
ncbi:hypothetical protein MBLNU459_g1627t1 [Dothideomycetes sp. NU459]